MNDQYMAPRFINPYFRSIELESAISKDTEGGVIEGQLLDTYGRRYTYKANLQLETRVIMRVDGQPDKVIFTRTYDAEEVSQRYLVPMIVTQLMEVHSYRTHAHDGKRCLAYFYFQLTDGHPDSEFVTRGEALACRVMQQEAHYNYFPPDQSRMHGDC